MQTPAVVPIPHVGGPIVGPGVPTILIAGIPAAVLGDMCICVGPPDVIMMGSFTVLFAGKPAARMGDMTAHGGAILGGCPTVLIGDSGGGAGGGAAATMLSARASGAPFTPMNCAAAAAMEAAKGSPLLAGAGAPSAAPSKAPSNPAGGSTSGTPPRATWVEIEALDQDNKPVPNERYRVVAPGRDPIEGFLNDKGFARVDGIDPGNCTISFPDLDARTWKPG
jgi:uncharacterized Zn-binding protein involved in type VI secretion